MAVLTSYFDASGSPSLEVVAVSGLVSTPEKWNAFNGDWNECLSVHGVSALHMKHFSQFRGEFSSWDEPHRRRFLNGLLWIVENQLDYTSGCAVAMRDYNAADAKYMLSEFMRPYTLASLTCAAEIVKWVENAGQDRESIIYVFEKGDTDQSDLRAKWEKLYPRLRVDPNFKKKTDCYPDPKAATTIRPFEAADLVAYEIFKASGKICSQGGEVYEDDLRKPIQRMKTLPGAQNWHFLDLPAIEQICSAYHVPLRG